MESDEVIPSSPSDKQKQTYSEYLDALCPFYIECGISADEFWNGDYTYFSYYVDAFRQRKRRENESMWIMGQYVADALLSTVCNQLSPKNATKTEYPSRPVPLTKQEAKEREEAELREKQEAMKRAFKAQAERINEKFRRKK